VTKSDGMCRIDAVEVGELSFVQIGTPTPTLSVKYAYANAESGERFGYGNRNSGWSEETLAALGHLLELVERDVCHPVFHEGTTTGTLTETTDTTGGIPSL
jgi:hypothetical protein